MELLLEPQTHLVSSEEGQKSFFRWKCRECGTVGVVGYKDVYDDVTMNRLSDLHASVTSCCPSIAATVLDLLENWSRGEGIERLPAKFRGPIHECSICGSWTRGTFCLSCGDSRE